MRPSVRRVIVIASLAWAMVLSWASPVFAHGIDSGNADKSVMGFVSVGIEHMLLGWDHLLFVAAVLLVAVNALLAAKLISLFVLGHSTTLIAATIADWRVNPDAVDVVIALSVVFAAGVALFARPKDFRWFGATVLGFGLVHGLGLATRFQDLGVPEGGELPRVIAFNVGIEIGQATAIMGIVAVAAVADSVIGEARRAGLLEAGAALLLACGVAASAMVAYNGPTRDDAADDVAVDVAPVEYAGSTGSCAVGARTESLPGNGDHAQRDFFEPDEDAPLADFGHVVGDGYVALLYPTALEAPGVEELRTFVTSEDGQGMFAGATGQVRDRFVAITVERQLTCEELDVMALQAFRSDWFSSR